MPVLITVINYSQRFFLKDGIRLYEYFHRIDVIRVVELVYIRFVVMRRMYVVFAFWSWLEPNCSEWYYSSKFSNLAIHVVLC